MATEQFRPVTIFDLTNHVDRFISDNRHSQTLEDRWLAHFLQEVALPTLQEVRNKNIGPKARKAMNGFRAMELEVELENDRKQMQRTERELEKLRT